MEALAGIELSTGTWADGFHPWGEPADPGWELRPNQIQPWCSPQTCWGTGEGQGGGESCQALLQRDCAFTTGIYSPVSYSKPPGF